MYTRYRNTEQQSGVYGFGEKSSVANWMVGHVFFLVSGVILCMFVIATVDRGWGGWTDLGVIPLVIFLPAICLRLLLHDRCYWIEIDAQNEKIRFFRFFNKNIVEADLRSVKFVFTWKMTAVCPGVTVSINHEDIVRMNEAFSQFIKIKFSENFYGRLANKQFFRTKLRLQQSKFD